MTPAALAENAITEAAREARVLASKAGDAVEDGMRAARRSFRTAQHRAEDAAGDAATIVRKQPLMSVGAALGAGLVLGVAGARIARAVAGRCAKSV